MNVIILYENSADVGTLSGGGWLSALPLTNMQDPRVRKKARSTNLDPANTFFKIGLTKPKTLRAIAFGPTNYTGGGTYRIRGYSDAAYSSALVVDTGAIQVGAAPVSTLSLHWTDFNWWSGAIPIDDPDHAGTWVIHVFAADQTAQYWRFDLDDQSNPDGYLEVGRLFMGTSYIPTYNYSENARFGFSANTAVQKAASGSRYYNRRLPARTFSFELNFLPETEVEDDVNRLAIVAGLDSQVFLITKPDDSDRRSKLSFLGNLDKMPEWSLQNIDRASVGFQITEAL